VWDALGEKRKTLEYYEAALPLYQAVGDRGGEAATLNNMAVIYFHEGNLERAAEIFQQIIEVTQTIGAVAEEALFLVNIAVVYQRMGRIGDAIAAAERGREILVRYNLPQNAAGATIAQYDHLLRQLKGEDTSSPQENEMAQAMQALAQLYAQGGADAVRSALAQGGVPEAAIEQIMALLAGNGGGE
jgi:tetratricopeptide (TPR) repeat protein